VRVRVFVFGVYVLKQHHCITAGGAIPVVGLLERHTQLHDAALRGYERGSQGARERGNEGAREQGSEGARERESEGARERGSEGARERKRAREREASAVSREEAQREGHMPHVNFISVHTDVNTKINTCVRT